ncbi:MAG: TPM domain-containing protein [Sphingomonas sp.]|uniref:TPM domain-containing protein n=1 Tax=Sphingomonas sp. TaxID=28214 RepID=UPI0035670F3C
MLLALALAGCGGAAPAVPVAQATAPAGYAFPALVGRVVDKADLLTPPQEAALSAQSAALEKATGHQFVIVTVTSLGGHKIEDYGLALGNFWRLGRKGANDGVLLIVAPTERKVRIEVGRGLESTLTNARAKAIIDDDILPAFRSGDMSGGIVAGTGKIIDLLAPVGATST